MGALGEACGGVDVVNLLLNAQGIEWYDLFPPRLDAAIAVAEATGAKLIFHDSV